MEDAPALDPLAKFDIIEKDGAVYIKGEAQTIKANRRQLDTKCSVQGQEKVIVIGGYVPHILNSLERNLKKLVQWERSNGRCPSSS